VLEPGATSRRLYLPRGRWVDFWRSIRYVERTGALTVRGAKVLRGGRDVTLAAPIDRLPLLIRAGALLPLLPADVDTLSSYADPSTTSLRERRSRVRLLAFPRGTSSARFGASGRLRSRERPGRWALQIRAGRSHRFDVEAALGSLERPFRACEVSVDGRPLARRRWSVRGGVLAVRFDGRRPRLVVSAC
jgi:hypothetical protein